MDKYDIYKLNNLTKDIELCIKYKTDLRLNFYELDDIYPHLYECCHFLNNVKVGEQT